MKRTSQLLLSLFLLLQCIFLLSTQISGADKLEIGQNLTDGETLISAGGSFTLGFFSPGVSTKRYLGIWFAVSNDTVYWVANRDNPLDDRSGTLVLDDGGSLVLLDGSRRMAWYSEFPGSASAAVAQLLESGNLVVRNGSREAFLWQSFDHPSDTLLAGMKLGRNFWSGAKWELTSWRSADDPSPGDYIRTLETTQTSGLPELVLWHRGAKTFRTGPWNGRWFNGAPEASTFVDKYRLHVTTSATETTYGYSALPGAPLTRVMVNHTGVAQRLVWDASSRTWISFFKGPKGDCDAYAHCGAFGLCNGTALSVCGCVPGFSPTSPSAWQLKQYAGGCRRDKVMDCGGGTSTDRFKAVTGVKLPDTQNASVDTGVTLDECKARCYANCSCLAYAAAYIQDGGDGTGCVIWADAIVDLRLVDRGQNLFLRLSKSEVADDRKKGKKFPTVAVAAAVASLVTVLLVTLLIWWRLRPKILGTIPLQSFNLATMKHVTSNFSEINIIHEDEVCVAYKGQLDEGRMIALKRLKQSALVRKGKRYFARQVEVMARLRHGSIVCLLAYCNQGKERIVVYEYMENNSLDFYIFGTTSIRASLNWARRLEIIRRIAQGVAYLHVGSGKSVIHMDLKPANILLDDEWKAKIANFGIKNLLTVDHTGPDKGYAAPEYEQRGEMTLKCDVYSFGVIILETLSGQRNGATNTSLLSHVWGLWERDNVMELLDSAVTLPPTETELSYELKLCIEIGILCVQETPRYRPAMSAIVAMLTNTTSQRRISGRDSLVTAWSHDREDDLYNPQ